MKAAGGRTLNTAFLYKVRAVAPSIVPYSMVDLAAVTNYSRPTLTPGVTGIAAIDIIELRSVLAGVRTLSAGGMNPLTDPVLDSTVTVKAAHINELLSMLNDSRGDFGLLPISLTGGAITATSSLIRATDVTDLRNGMR